MKRGRWLFLAVAVLLFGIPAWLTYRQIRQEQLNRALIEAIKIRKDVAVIAALDAGASPNSKDYPEDKRPFWKRLWDTVRGKHLASYAETALMSAFDNSKRKGVKAATLLRLIREGADVNTKDEYGITALMCAASPRYVKVAALLLDKGAQVNARNTDGDTPLAYAVAYDKTGATADLLLQHGADVRAANKEGNTALHYAVTNNASLEVVRHLLERRASVNVRGSEGMTPLHCAVEEDRPEIVRLLLAHGADVKVKDKQGETALSEARTQGEATIVKLLKQAGAKE